MNLGPYEITVYNHGLLRLDGGAMFGAVPKTLWSRQTPADDLNRITLATNSLVIQHGERRLVVDLGCGEKWSEKLRKIYAIENRPMLDGITDVFLTHLHFDHTGGISQPGGTPTYPDAIHYVSSVNLENARNPNVRERASYLEENVSTFDKVDTVLLEDGAEIWPGITAHRADGHTRGLMWLRITDGEQTIAYPTDLFPTSKHLPVPYAMGYDICAEQAMREKGAFLEEAIEGNWIVVFEHDPEVPAARLAFDEAGRPQVADRVEL